MLHAISTLALALLLAGFLLRRRRNWHIPLVVSAFTLDLGLTLYLEFTRAAVEKVLHGTKPIVLFHAAVSTVVLGLYVLQAVMGNRVRHGKLTSAGWHRRVGWTLVACRSANYATSWML